MGYVGVVDMTGGGDVDVRIAARAVPLVPAARSEARKGTT